jgi:DUF1680 family protein
LALLHLPSFADEPTFVPTPPLDVRNRHYVSNREPLLPNPLVKLPIGAVQPRGWLRKQLELQAAGFHGHLTEISQFLKKENNAWLHPEGQGERGWEEVPYWLKGFGDTAYLLGNLDQIKEAKVWIEGTIKSQGSDGMFGPRGKGAKSTVSSTKGKYDLWSNMVMMHCLQSYYEVTGDKRVIDLMTKYFKWQLTIPDEDLFPPYWQHQRAADNLGSVLWLYNHTGDKFLLELAHKNHRRTANWTADVPDWHNVNMTQAFGGPAFYYPLSKDRKHLDAAERNWTKIRGTYGQVPGGLFAGDENCRPGFADPRQAIETCGMVEFMFSCERLLTIAADPRWADHCEDVAFNSLPAALTPDFKGLRYLTAPNLVSSDKGNKSPGFENSGPMLQMNPHIHRCCQHNFGHGWPYFAQHLWYATSDNGLAAVMYSASQVKAKVGDGTEVTITEATKYPFDESIEFVLSLPKAKRFPIYLRVPAWCEHPSVELAGKASLVLARKPGYLKLDREWRDGDRIKLTLPMHVTYRTWKANKHSVSIDRGPLTYSLKIGEKYVRSGGTDQWPAWDILPTTPWNYGLVYLDPSPIDAIVKRPWPASDMPFTPEGTPIELRARGRKIPQWKTDYLGLVGLLQPSPAKSNEPDEVITLIPMGAARLRLTAFPFIGHNPNAAHTWTVPPEAKPLKVTASHCYAHDSPRAIGDLVVPKHSADTTVPRFTWWDHRGTAEWIQWEFEAPRKVNEVKIYWFDDEPKGGGCRVPASWKLLYRKNGEWVAVSGASSFGTAKDLFNRVRFDAVTTDALRMEVQLQPKMSAGILEWEIP